MFKPDCALEVREPPSPHQPRGLQAPHDAVAPVSRGWSAFVYAPWSIGHEARGNQGQLHETGAAALCGYEGHYTVIFLLAR